MKARDLRPGVMLFAYGGWCEVIVVKHVVEHRWVKGVEEPTRHHEVVVTMLTTDGGTRSPDYTPDEEVEVRDDEHTN